MRFVAAVRSYSSRIPLTHLGIRGVAGAAEMAFYRSLVGVTFPMRSVRLSAGTGTSSIPRS